MLHARYTCHYIVFTYSKSTVYKFVIKVNSVSAQFLLIKKPCTHVYQSCILELAKFTKVEVCFAADFGGMSHEVMN